MFVSPFEMTPDSSNARHEDVMAQRKHEEGKSKALTPHGFLCDSFQSL
jgi:hypothetical protein